MRSYDECLNTVDQILDLRKEGQKYEIIKHLKNASSESNEQSDGMDTRIDEILIYSKYLHIGDSSIGLNIELIDELAKKIERFEAIQTKDKVHNTNRCSAYNADAPENYFEMLTNPGTPW